GQAVHVRQADRGPGGRRPAGAGRPRAAAAAPAPHRPRGRDRSVVGGVGEELTIMTNPLRDPQDRRLPRIPEPCALVIFGVTGDLARKKLIPAVYDLANRGLLPPGFVVLGFARRDWGDGDFETIAKAAAQKHARTPWSEDVWARVHGNIKFVPGSFEDDTAFDQLAQTLDELQSTHGIPGNAAFYLSIPPAAFPM